jgi:hypothetical protein
MTFDGTCERGGFQRAPQEIEKIPPGRGKHHAASTNSLWLCCLFQAAPRRVAEVLCLKEEEGEGEGGGGGGGRRWARPCCV